MEESHTTEDYQTPQAVGVGPVVTLYITTGDRMSVVELAEKFKGVFPNFSVYTGDAFIRDGEFNCCYMVKLLTKLEPEELLGVLALMRDTYKWVIGFEAQGNFYTVK